MADVNYLNTEVPLNFNSKADLAVELDDVPVDVEIDLTTDWSEIFFTATEDPFGEPALEKHFAGVGDAGLDEGIEIVSAHKFLIKISEADWVNLDRTKKYRYDVKLCASGAGIADIVVGGDLTILKTCSIQKSGEGI